MPQSEYFLPERGRIVGFVCPWAGENPVPLRRWAETFPFEQNGCDVWIQGQFVLRTFRFQLRDLAASVPFLGGVRKVAPLDLFADVAIDQALKSGSLAHRQAIVDFQSETFGGAPGIRLGWIIFDSPQGYRGSCR